MGSMRTRNAVTMQRFKSGLNRLNFPKILFSLGVFILYDSICFLKKRKGFFNFPSQVNKIKTDKTKRNNRHLAYHVLIVLMFFAGCNSEFTFDVIDGPTGSEALRYTIPNKISIPAHVPSIEIAAENWNKALGRELFCKNCDGYPIEVEFVDNLEDITHRDETDHAAITKRLDNQCFIFFKNHSEQFHYEELAVATHELGHCIGFTHSSFERSLMAPVLDGDNHFTSEIVRVANQ